MTLVKHRALTGLSSSALDPLLAQPLVRLAPLVDGRDAPNHYPLAPPGHSVLLASEVPALPLSVSRS